METESKKRGKIPFWMKNVKSTPDLVLRYQVQTKELDDVLQSDLKVLRKMNQVNKNTLFVFSSKIQRNELKLIIF